MSEREIFRRLGIVFVFVLSTIEEAVLGNAEDNKNHNRLTNVARPNWDDGKTIVVR